MLRVNDPFWNGQTAHEEPPVKPAIV